MPTSTGATASESLPERSTYADEFAAVYAALRDRLILVGQKVDDG
jgi:hypothetical protein